LSRRPAWAAFALIALVAVALGAIIWATAVRPSGGRSITLHPSGIAPEATGELRFESGAATLEVKGMPLLTAEQQYQLWLVRDGDRDSGAVFSVNDNGWAEVPVEAARSPGDPSSDYTDLWISIEPAGGSPDPTGEWVLEWGSE
jgi:anti-sigma-K factor RskA